MEDSRAYSAYSFALRFKTYVKSFSPGQSLYYWHCAQKTVQFKEFLRLEKTRIKKELREQYERFSDNPQHFYDMYPESAHLMYAYIPEITQEDHPMRPPVVAQPDDTVVITIS